MDWQSIEKEIKSIPGNEPVLDNLHKLLESGNALALVGAGASAGLWPLWNEFLNGFIDSLKGVRITSDEADYFRKEVLQSPLEIAQQLRNKIGEKLYFEYMQVTFQDKDSSETGGAFTPTHRALLQLPIRNYLTLNYDAGLTNARAFLYPKATTSYYFWDQEDARRIRDPGIKRLVLHAHGRHDRADSIILTLDDYRKAYDNRPFVRLLDDIFAFEKIIMVGFGLTDPYIKLLLNNINKDFKKSALGHIAFVGLDDKDANVTHLHRERVEMVYGAKILFYPTANHHKALTDWLTALAEKVTDIPGSRAAEETQSIPVDNQLKEAIPDKYVHKPTDDGNYKGRERDIGTLNRWANDPATRTIAITGIGGQGKTSLIGRWLRHKRTPELAKMPVFYWSFYEDMDVVKFIEQIVQFCGGVQEKDHVSSILQVVRKVRLLLVLDGLEVMQVDLNRSIYGRITNLLLEQFLQEWLRYKHQGLMILTSRFQFPQLDRFRGAGFHHLSLVRLSTEDGVSLLRKLGILGEIDLLENYVEKLYGHPLALRVLASTVKRSCHSDLSQFNGESVLNTDGDKDKLSRKLQHLLDFYESQLINGQKELLGILSLFKRPVGLQSFITLVRKMKSLENTPLATTDEAEIQRQLNLLAEDFLVEKTDEGITTHPVIRDYFRSGYKLAGSRREVANYLEARPGAQRPQTIDEVRDLVEAVQLLCDEGEFEAAEVLCTLRLGAGGYGFDVFRDLPAVTEGIDCDMAFVGDKDRIKKLECLLGKNIIAVHCSGVSLYNYYLGNLVNSLEWRNKSLEIYRKKRDKKNQAGELQEISLIESVMGNLLQAREIASEAINLSLKTKAFDDLIAEFAYKAYYEFLLGNSGRAYQDFQFSLLSWKKIRAVEQHLSSLWGCQQAELLIRNNVWENFEIVNAWNIQICEKDKSNNILSLCYLLGGWYEICRGQLTQAEESLMQAERILRPSGMVESTCRLDWVWGLLAEAKRDYEKGLQKVNDALFVAADKSFRLRQADCLILRGRLNLMKFQKENSRDRELLEKVGDDVNDALKIAKQTGYIWPRVEALELFANYHKVRAGLEGYDRQDENDKSRSYAKQAAEMRAGLMLSEEQMQQLKTEARREFETLTAG